MDRRTFIKGLIGGLSFLHLELSLKAAAQVAKPFSFAYICDVHLQAPTPDLGFKLSQEAQLFLQEAVKQINLSKVDFVVFGGDQVAQLGKNEANWQLFLDIAQTLNCPWYFVLGEQDVSGKLAVDKKRTFGPDWKGKGIEGDTAYWSLNPVPNLHIVGLDSSVANSAAGEIDQAQLKWLDADLTKNKGKFTIVFCHHPLLPPPPFDGGPPWDEHVLTNGSDVREILGKYVDVHMVVSGHLFLNKIQKERDIYHVSSAGLDAYPCVYKLFHVSSRGIAVETVPLAFPALIKKARKLLSASTLASRYNRKDPEAYADILEGGKLDRSALLPLTAKGEAEPLQKSLVPEADKRRSRKRKERPKKEPKRRIKEPKAKMPEPEFESEPQTEPENNK